MFFNVDNVILKLFVTKDIKAALLQGKKTETEKCTDYETPGITKTHLFLRGFQSSSGFII